MSRASFSYVIYIHGTAEDVWNGLVDPELTSRYWFHENVSDWKAGSGWVHRRTFDDDRTVDIVGEVLESSPPHRLVLSWCPPGDTGDPDKVSKVSFEISAQPDWPFGPWQGLRLVHSDLEADSEMHQSVTFGWPAVLSGLKTVVESPEIFDTE